MGAAFDSLAPELREVIYQANWPELRPIQVEAITEIRDGKKDLIISAATASGKTEAAFLPTLSQLLHDHDSSPGIRILYLAPLKALINDQAQRLKDLLSRSDFPVHSWHGDIPADRKKKVREAPSGLLLITPESLESCFINYGRFLPQMFGNLDFIVIDELHAFISDVRGIHLASLLARLEVISKTRPRRLGLSATLADFSQARSFLNRKNPDKVHLIEDAPGSRSISIGLRAYPHPAKEKEQLEEKAAEKPPCPELAPDSLLAAELARVFRHETNLIFTNSRALAELLSEEIDSIARREKWPRNPFLIHHGSLSKEVREDTEKLLKLGQENFSVFCTSTLEMGIDIGQVKTVGQLSPPWSVASLVQRLGRSGRKEGESAILRMYALDDPVLVTSPLENQFRPQLLRSIAMVELMKEKWLEPHPAEHLQLSTFIQQILSILRQTGGCTAAHIHQTLCQNGIFDKISADDFRLVLRSLGAHDLIEQMPDGTLILAPSGESLTHSRDFYAAFHSTEDFSVRHQGNSIGLLPADKIPPQGECFILNSKRWQVDEVLNESNIVEVIPTSAKKPPFFGGEPGMIHARIHQKMREILSSQETFAYLHKDALNELAAARKTFGKLNLGQQSHLVDGSTIYLFPWAGTLTLRTFAMCGLCAGLAVTPSPKGLGLIYKDLSLTELEAHLADIAEGRFSPVELSQKLPNKYVDKYDHLTDKLLLERVNSERSINLTATIASAQTLIK